MNYAAFERLIEARRFEPFAWGRNDCALFAADAVLALTGKDYAEGLRGYKTALGALKRIARAGGLDEIVSARMREIDPVLAQRGDPVLFETRDGDALGVCLHTHFAAAGPDGLVFAGMSNAKRAWSCHQQS
jgi:hypothetical protein